MTTAITLEQYLDGSGITYDVVPHPPTACSRETAEVSHISANKLAKAVVLRGDNGYLLAVLPASRRLKWKSLTDCLDQNVTLATEDEIAWLFPDCEIGAVPPVGQAYGIDTIVDDSIAEQPDIYFEGGDHSTLVHMARPAFDRLTESARHACFTCGS